MILKTSKELKRKYTKAYAAAAGEEEWNVSPFHQTQVSISYQGKPSTLA
jgi:hypothetical protein